MDSRDCASVFSGSDRRAMWSSSGNPARALLLAALRAKLAGGE
jgi:hypothetical protein